MSESESKNLVEHLKINRREHLFTYPKFFEDWCVNNILYKNDRINMNHIYVLSQVTMTSGLAIFAAFYYGSKASLSNPYVHLLGIAYVVTHFLVWAKSFILSMHYTVHTPIFVKKGPFSILNYYASYILCITFGIAPGQFFLHHVVMHHKEENLFPSDISSTEIYDRSKRSHLFLYVARYLFGVYVELPYYAFIKKRYDLLQWAIVGLSIYFLALKQLYDMFPAPTLYCFIIPMLIVAYALMEGNILTNSLFN